MTRDETADGVLTYLKVWNARDLTMLDTVAHPDVVHRDAFATPQS